MPCAWQVSLSFLVLTDSTELGFVAVQVVLDFEDHLMARSDRAVC